MALTAQDLQATGTGVLMVCLCDLDGSKIDGGPIGLIELCEQHENACKLKSIDHLGVCLHVTDKNGDVVPVIKDW